MAETFNYQDKTVKLSDEFKQKYMRPIKNKDAITAEGLTAFSHQKGIWKLETKILQYPSKENDNMCICQTTIGGYDWDPVTKQIREVEYSDIGDASPSNCTSMVAASFIRMASTRSQARAMRKYTNIDMLCTSELSEVMDSTVPLISPGLIAEIKAKIREKQITPTQYMELLTKYNTADTASLTETQGQELLAKIANM